MSETQERAAIDLQAIIARTDRDLAESAKLREETRQFVTEAHRIEAERRKLDAEARKLERERWWFPWLQLLTVVASSAAIAALVARVIR